MPNNFRQRPEGALLRTYLSAAGVSTDSIAKPIIGVATVATQVFSERPDARDLGNAVIQGLEAAGGIAVRMDTVRSPDLMTWGHAESYSFAWRDQLADFIESWAQQHALDGLVLVGDAPETLIGMSMAATRLGLPGLLVTTGARRWEYDQQGEGNGKKKEFSDPYELMANALFAKKKGQQKDNPPDQLNQCLLSEDDHSGFAIDLVIEALGLCLPGMATAAVQSVRRHELAYASGQRIIQLVKTGTTLKRTLTANAFSNAIRLNAAVGGSIDVAVHLMGLAHEAGLTLSFELFDRIAHTTPQLCHLGGVSNKEPHRMEDLDKAGGVWAIFHALKNQIAPTTTLSGKGALELAKTTQIKDTHVIHSNRPIRKQSGLGIVRGNLALNGAVFLLNQVLSDFKQFRGKAVVFESEQDAAQALTEGRIKKGTAIVVRGQGPKGGPGLPKLRILPALLENRNLNKTIPLLTDGRLPETPAGIFISLISPEGAANGPLAILRNDDLIDIDLETKQLAVRLTDTELRIRLARWQAPEPKVKTGFLNRYSKSVSEVSEGAILK